jgi:hypothetical protein
MHRKRGTQAVAGRFLCGSAACKFGPLVRLGGPAGFFRCIRTGRAFFESPCSTGPALEHVDFFRNRDSQISLSVIQDRCWGREASMDDATLS